MKAAPAPKKKKLSLENSNDFAALGISCAEKDYRLCFKINKTLNIEFQKDARLIVLNLQTKQKHETECYIYKDVEMLCTFYLVKNRQEAFFVQAIYRQADYILLMQPPLKADFIAKIKQKLSAIPIIQSTFAIPTEQLKHIDAE